MTQIFTTAPEIRSLEYIHPGMGSIVHQNGVAFRVWAPNADSVSVIGTFNDWNENIHLMQREDNGTWYTDIEPARVGDQYKFFIRNGDQELARIDPYAREVTNSIGNAVVYQDTFDWQEDDFQRPPQNEVVIYEMHIGTFNRNDPTCPGTFDDAREKLPHLQRLGVNAVQIMPIAEFAGDLSWGYNPAHPFAVEQAYGGPDALKRFVRAAHRSGIAVIIDVVYNHFGPSDLDLWQFDGWSENGKGGIYFYQDQRSSTPWGDTRPDYGRSEVRQFIYDNAMMWMRDYHADGLRYDMTAYIRTISGIGGDEIAEGWGLMQWINRELQEQFPGCYLVAEDLQTNHWLTRSENEGGAGFTTQWDAAFVHPIRETVQQLHDAARDMWSVRDALCHRYNDDAFQRVVYCESHDEVANGKSRVPSEIDPENPESVYAKKRTVLAAALTMVAPGVPMLFQGQELLEDEWFRDTDPIDWERGRTLGGIQRLFRDLIHLRLNREGVSAGLLGQHIAMHHVNQQEKVISFVRSDDDGQAVLIVANFGDQAWPEYQIGFPTVGHWQLRLNSDWMGYDDSFGNHPARDIDAESQPRDGLPASAAVTIGSYSVLIYSRGQ